MKTVTGSHVTILTQAVCLLRMCVCAFMCVCTEICLCEYVGMCLYVHVCLYVRVCLYVSLQQGKIRTEYIIIKVMTSVADGPGTVTAEDLRVATPARHRNHARNNHGNTEATQGRYRNNHARHVE